MDIKEIRIGNTISVKHPSENDGWYDVEVKGIAEDGTISTDSFGNIYGTNDANILMCKGIPLTEGWLIRFGFEMWEECLTLSIHKSKIQYSDSSKEIYFQGYFNADWITIDCEYVHSLQNLYFALTGKELETK